MILFVVIKFLKINKELLTIYCKTIYNIIILFFLYLNIKLLLYRKNYISTSVFMLSYNPTLKQILQM